MKRVIKQIKNFVVNSTEYQEVTNTLKGHTSPNPQGLITQTRHISLFLKNTSTSGITIQILATLDFKHFDNYDDGDFYNIENDKTIGAGETLIIDTNTLISGLVVNAKKSGSSDSTLNLTINGFSEVSQQSL